MGQYSFGRIDGAGLPEWGVLHESDMVTFGDYRVPPVTMYREITESGTELQVEVRVRDGEAHVTEVSLREPVAVVAPITNSTLRRLREVTESDHLAKIVCTLSYRRDVEMFGFEHIEDDPPTRRDGRYLARFTETASRRIVGQPVPGVRDNARRRSRLDESDFLAKVAEVYREGGRAGAQAVAAHFGKSLRMAQHYVARARAGGFLGPAVVGKAGEDL